MHAAAGGKGVPSSFPGMNPYLEHPAVWTGFHDRFLVYAAEVLNAQTLPHFVVDLGEHVFVTDPETGANGSAYYADLSAADTARAAARLPKPARRTPRSSAGRACPARPVEAGRAGHDGRSRPSGDRMWAVNPIPRAQCLPQPHRLTSTGRRANTGMTIGVRTAWRVPEGLL